MSKVGESIIQGAKEALEFAQSDDNGCEGKVSDTDALEGQDSVSKTTERTEG
jgi:hypothetical protein